MSEVKMSAKMDSGTPSVEPHVEIWQAIDLLEVAIDRVSRLIEEIKSGIDDKPIIQDEKTVSGPVSLRGVLCEADSQIREQADRLNDYTNQIRQLLFVR